MPPINTAAVTNPKMIHCQSVLLGFLILNLEATVSQLKL